MSAVRDWLEAIGLGQYANAFDANDIDTDLLSEIDDQVLKDIGVSSAGHRLRLRKAIAKLTPTSIVEKKAESGVTVTEASATAAERRQLTVLFCDLVGSTALSARLDPEDLRAVIGAYHSSAAAVIERAGGFVAKYMGDGVLAYFGYPRADEHDPERAVRAGLALVEAAAGLETAAGAPLQVRVGIATGLVVVGDLVGEGPSQEQAVVGETPNLAARLQTLAEPSSVVIAPSTRRLTGRLFDYEDLGAVEIKGFFAPVMASRVVRESAVEGRFAALRTSGTPLVGRDEELALLERRWQQANAGEGCVVLVSGEPGIGKSRLAQTLFDQIAGEPHTRLRFFCSPHHQDSALYPAITQLERAAGFRRDDTVDRRLDKLEAVLSQATSGLILGLTRGPPRQRSAHAGTAGLSQPRSAPPHATAPGGRAGPKAMPAGLPGLPATALGLLPCSGRRRRSACRSRPPLWSALPQTAVPRRCGQWMSPAQLDEALAQLVGADLIYRRGTPPDAEYSFKHALVQDAAYGTLLRSRRQQLHARIAATLEDRFPEIVTAQPALLAHHCTAAGLTEQAVAYWLAAGRHALARSAAAEAAALLRRGLALVPALPDTVQRRETELDLQIALGQALITSRMRGVPGLAEAYSRARELALALNRPRALVSILFGQLYDDWAQGDLQRAQRRAAELRDLGETNADDPAQVLGWNAGGFTSWLLGAFTTGRAQQEKALALYDPADRASYAELLPVDARVILRGHLSYVLACLGNLDQALQQRDAALDEARRLSHAPTLAIALAIAWLTSWLVRLEPGSLVQVADEELAVATEHGLEHFRMFALIHRGWSLAGLGFADDGIPLLAAGLRDLGYISFRPLALTLLADACRVAGQWRAALAHVAEARHLAEETEARWFQAETLRLTGDVLLATGDAAAAEASYREGIAIAQQQSAKLWELRAATSLARLWHEQSQLSEARDLLVPVYDWFTEGFGTPVLQEAKALLEEMAA
jgi:class 3 adenylate cyclase/tetratricopeptide (TPR) repeat protein